ncbi:MAG: copper-binding protein, partial [Azoarcus sp.]|nr:copper-binding protein [Azoarcus sp.]
MNPRTDPRSLAAAFAALAAFTLVLAPPALAQHDHDHHAPARMQTAPIASGQGVVKKIDPAKQRLTLQHDPIPALGWPAMTMP